MASLPDRHRRPAKFSRWATTGLTAAVTVGAVAAMADAAPDESFDEVGATIGAVAGYEGVIAAAAMMAAADPGTDEPSPLAPPTIARANVS